MVCAQVQIQYTYDAAGNVIQVTRTAATPKPDLTVSNLVVGFISANANGSYNIAATFQVNNAGSVNAVATWYDRGYLSASTVLHNTDPALGGYNTRSANLGPGANYSVSTTFTTSAAMTPGTYTLIVKADGGAGASGQYSPTGANYVDEADETNNAQTVAITLLANPKPDLTVSNLTASAITVSQNGAYNIPVTFQVNNIGPGIATASWYDFGYLSPDSVLNDTDQILGGQSYRTTNAAGGTSYTVSKTFTTSTATTPGNYSLIVKADGGGGTGQYSPTGANYVAEVNEANNTQSVAITLPIKPDLTVSNLTLGAVSVNQNGAYLIPVTFQVNNVGGSAAVATWNDRGYLSTDAVLSDTDQILGGSNYRTANLAAGASYPVSVTFTTSTATTPGNYSLVVKADGGASTGQYSPTGANYVAEANEANNTQAVAATLPIKPDLAASNLAVGTITTRTGGGYNIPVTFTVTNVGQSAAMASWYDRGYLSTDAILQNADQVLGSSNYRTTNLAAGASYNVSITLTTSTSTTAGTFTLFVKADGGSSSSGRYSPTGPNYLVEANANNNVVSAMVLLP